MAEPLNPVGPTGTSADPTAGRPDVRPDDWALGLVRIAGRLDRDLQAASRRAGGPRRLWTASDATIARVFARTPDVGAEFIAARRELRPADLRAQLEAETAWFTGTDHGTAAERLGALPDPPFGLIGTGSPLEASLGTGVPCVAVVGSRRPTAFGLQFTADLAAGLGAMGAIIVSGLAIGIDAAAHRGALTVGASTIAVLGCGVGVDHPRTNSSLRRQIVEAGGTVLSEYWTTTPPSRWRFPARNRIVAGLADAVVVTEAAARSGALITADFALELGRPVLAVPGRPGVPASSGCHALLRAGAAFCETADDVVAELSESLWTDGTPSDAVSAPADGLAALIHALLRSQPSSLTRITEALDRPAAEIATCLTEMELSGAVVAIDGHRYAVRGV